MSAATDTPRIWVGCLGCYNAGRLHGEWFDVPAEGDVGPTTLGNEITTWFAGHPTPDGCDHEELQCLDHEGLPGVTGEPSLADLDDLCELAAFLEEAEDGHGRDVAEALLGYHCGRVDDARTALEECYGVWESLKEWAIDYLDNTGELSALPTQLQYYFDHAAFARDCKLSGDIYTVDLPGGRVLVVPS